MSDSSAPSKGYPGQLDQTDQGSDFNQHAFAVDQRLGRVRTMVPVKVVKVSGGGTKGPASVDVQILVKQMDSEGKATSHGNTLNIPHARPRCGDSVIIMDPKVGDIGFMSIADRDISSLKANGGQESAPGSFRRHNLADGVYHAQALDQSEPKQWLSFTDDGIELADRNGNVLKSSKADGWTMNGVKISQQGAVKAPGNVTAGDGTGDSVDLQGHTHGSGPAPTAGS